MLEYVCRMAFLLGIILATLGVAFCIAAGLLLLLIPRWRQLAPYAFLVYPSAYFAGLFSLFFIGFLVNPIVDRYSHSNLAAGIGVVLMFGLAALGALAGAISGFVLANRIWWRFFASPEDRGARPQLLRWLALTPFVGNQPWLLYHWSRAVGDSTTGNGAQVTTSHNSDKYQGTT
jgi:hypothetical protein